MKQDNICLFPQSLSESNDNSLTILNLVKENSINMNDSFLTQAVFRLYLVCSGKGTLTTQQAKYNLVKSDIFVTFPAMPYYITNDDSLKMMYITFLGTRAYQILDQINITKTNIIRHNNSNLIKLWDSVFDNVNNVALSGEGLFLITASSLTNENIKEENSKSSSLNPKLSLAFIANELSYNEKYISKIFKDNFNTTIQNYIEGLRMNNALNLIESGITSVKEMAKFCGYSDPLYFSKIFKKYFGVSPKDYSKNLK